MATVKDLFQILSSFWKDAVASEDHALIEALWEGYLIAVQDQYRLLYAIDQSKSVSGVNATVERDWWHLDLGFSQALAAAFTYKLEEEIVSIPKLQQGIGEGHEGTVLTDTTDYVVNSQAHTITFVSAAAQALVSRDISLLDSLGRPTVAGTFVTGGILSSLTLGVDYSWLNPEFTLIRLHSKAAFDLFAQMNDGAATRALEDKILFAPTIHIDDRLVFKNFGFLLGISPDDIPVDVHIYTRIVKGLWYIAWNGPTPFNLGVGVSVLFGYPVAARAGQVHAIVSSGPDKVVTVATEAGELFDTLVPALFTVTVTVGQTVQQNQPLSDAVTIMDDQSHPGWWSALSLARYAKDGRLPPELTGEQQLELKASLKNAVFGIKLKDTHSEPEINLRAQVLTVASKFLNRLKPYYAQFAFVDSVLFVETVDEATAQDVALRMKSRKLMHSTVPDNHVNELFATPHDTSQFADYEAYEAAGDTPTDDNRAYYLGADAPLAFDDLSLKIKYPGSGGLFVASNDAAYETYAAGVLADITPPDLFLSPDPGEYFYEISVRVRPDEPCQMLYTLDGRTPGFGVPPVGSPVRDRIQIPEGNWVLKVVAKDLSGNVSPVLSANYKIALGLPPLKVTPDALLPSRASVAATLTAADDRIDVFFTTDGTAPTDFAFQDVLRLGGHRIVWDSPTSIRLEDPNRPVFFPRGTATLNVDGPRNYEIAPRRNGRYFVYAVRLGDNRWKVHFSLENIRFQPNTPGRLCMGFAVSNASGVFTPDSIINAVDAGDSVKLEKDAVITDGILNTDNPIPLQNDKTQRVLRFFGKTPGGLFDPPQTHIYTFDTVAPVTVLESTFSNQPFKKTLKIDFQVEPGSTVFWSELTKSPQRIIFGQTAKLVDDLSRILSLNYAAPNKVAPPLQPFNLTFRKRASTGELVDIVTTGDVRSGAVIRIPVVPDAFFDIAAVPDLDNPSKWRLDIGSANLPIQERPDVVLVSRVFTNEEGILDLSVTPKKGSILNGFGGAGLSNLARKTKKYVGEPVTFNVSVSPYKVVISYFAEDVAGNVEEVRSQTFEG